MNMNKYLAFGLVLQADRQFDELICTNSEKADITILCDKTPKELADAAIDLPALKINENEYFSDIKNVAKFYAGRGELILYEPYGEASWEVIKLYILGSCMGAVLYQRRILPLHGSCIHSAGSALALTGSSGAGKSTIAAMLCSRGCQLLTDDITVIGWEQRYKPTVYPGYPGMKLWEDALLRIGLGEQKKALNRFFADMEKYSVDTRGCFYDKAIPLKTIIELIPEKTKEIRLEEIKGGGKLEVIMNNMYRRLFAEAMELQQWCFKSCAELAERVCVYRLYRPEGLSLEYEIGDMILQIWQ